MRNAAPQVHQSPKKDALSYASMELPEVQQILARARALTLVENSVFDDDAETTSKLNAHGIPADLIATQLATLKSNSANRTAVLTSYSLLHSLQHLDVIQRSSPRRSDAADAVIVVYRCAEICLYNIGVLSTKMIAAVSAGNAARVTSLARWRVGFQEVLYRLSALAAEVGADSTAGDVLDIRHSRIYQEYLRQNAELQRFLMAEWPEAVADIFGKDLDDPQRFVFFNEFVNSSDERIWQSRLGAVRLPGVDRLATDDCATFYQRVVCTEQIELMAQALETKADTDLLSFRAVHQIAETIAGYVNLRLCGAIEQLVSPSPEGLADASRKLVLGNRLLSVVDDVMKLLLRALTPNAYKEIRPNLGMVKGTSSVMLRKTLFNTTYPLLLRAFKLRITGFLPALADDDDQVAAKAKEVLGAGGNPSQADMLRQLVVLHQHVRTWRDNHQQFPKTHLGISPVAERPTVSLSGSNSAVAIAHELRKVHGSDPIAPLYRAALGTEPPAVHELVTSEAFDEYMAHQTARAVFEVYSDVQERFYQRTGKPPASS